MTQNHLTDEQLSVLLDSALAPGVRAAFDAHLAGCDACRAKLADLAAQDAAMGGALAHDPGEAYFATFAERVAARIAAGEQPAARTLAPPRRSPLAWLLSPRGLSFVGGTAALLVTAGLAWLKFGREPYAARELRGFALTSPTPALREPLADSMTSPARSAGEMERSNAARAAHGSSVGGRAESEPRSSAPAPVANAPRDQGLASPPAGGEAEGAPLPFLTSQAPSPPATSAAREEVARVDAKADANADARKQALGARQKNESLVSQKLAKSSERPAWRPQLFSATPPTATPPAPTPPAATPSAANAPAPLEYKDAPRAPASGTRSAPRTAERPAERMPPAAEAQLQAGRPEDLDAFVGEALASPCGSVSDTRGRPVRGADITLLGTTTRTSRTGVDGTFCLPQAFAGDTLILMHVGFEPMRVVLTPSTSLAFALEPVGTLGDRKGLFFGGPHGASQLSPSPKTQGGLVPPASALSAPAPSAPVADAYAGQPDAVRSAVASARTRAAAARRDRTSPAWEAAAAAWDQVAARLPKGQGNDARFQSLVAEREAWRLGPTPARAARLKSALQGFLSGTPASLPEHSIALRWQGELAAVGR